MTGKHWLLAHAATSATSALMSAIRLLLNSRVDMVDQSVSKAGVPAVVYTSDTSSPVRP